METWKVQIMNQIHWQARPQAFPQHLEVAAKARRRSFLKYFSPNSIPLTRLERVKLQVGLSLDTESAQTFKYSTTYPTEAVIALTLNKTLVCRMFLMMQHDQGLHSYTSLLLSPSTSIKTLSLQLINH